MAGGSQGAYLEVGFDRLAAFDYEPPDRDRIPADIRALNGRKVAVKGFMMPLTVVGQVTTEFLIMRDQSACCFGVVPRMNYWVDVRVPGGVNTLMDRVVTAYGTLKVGEVRDGGYLVAI